MDHYIVVIILLVIAIAMSAVASKVKVPYPVLLLMSGIAVGFIPGFDFIPINPEVIFLIFLPPLLYNSAFNISIKEFKSNFRTISMMAFSLVFITMFSIAVVAQFLIPGMTWPLAFVIGAILSPPDAAAASGITKSLNLSHRTSTILEGESLINDASALIAYRVAVGVAIGGVFSFWDASLDFVLAIVGGCLIGVFLSYLFSYIIRNIKLENVALQSLNILLPFVAYLVAEELNVSGVLAVVMLGLLNASKIRKNNIFSEKEKLQFRSTWDVITYVLSGVIFILIGLEFPQVFSKIPAGSFVPLIISAIAIFLIALIIRIVVVFKHKWKLDRFISQIDVVEPKSNTRWSKKHAERVKELKPLNWKDALIIGWSGMRGIVSLATALALPMTMNTGEALPQRQIVIFLTVLVVILMLVIQGLGLPFLIEYLGVEADEEENNA